MNPAINAITAQKMATFIDNSVPARKVMKAVLVNLAGGDCLRDANALGTATSTTGDQGKTRLMIPRGY